MPYEPSIKFGLGQTLDLMPTVQQILFEGGYHGIYQAQDRSFYFYCWDNLREETHLPNGDIDLITDDDISHFALLYFNFYYS